MLQGCTKSIFHTLTMNYLLPLSLKVWEMVTAGLSRKLVHLASKIIGHFGFFLPTLQKDMYLDIRYI
jgi:hypothetical protein